MAKHITRFHKALEGTGVDVEDCDQDLAAVEGSDSMSQDKSGPTRCLLCGGLLGVMVGIIGSLILILLILWW